MAKTIWKFPLESDGLVEMPMEARVLSVQTQADNPMIWALVDPGASKELVRLVIYGTDHDLPDDPGRFVGTFQTQGGALVFHLFQPTT